MVEVQIDPLRGAAAACSLYIRQVVPVARQYVGRAEAEAQLEARRRFAD